MKLFAVLKEEGGLKSTKLFRSTIDAQTYIQTFQNEDLFQCDLYDTICNELQDRNAYAYEFYFPVAKTHKHVFSICKILLDS